MATKKQRSLVVLLSELEDPRVGNGVRHDLVEVMVIVICAIFSEVEGFKDMATWAAVKEPWLKRFLRLENGIPSHDTFNRIFRIIDPKKFEQVFRRWMGSVVGVLRESVAIDGQGLRTRIAYDRHGRNHMICWRLCCDTSPISSSTWLPEPWRRLSLPLLRVALVSRNR